MHEELPVSALGEEYRHAASTVAESSSGGYHFTAAGGVSSGSVGGLKVGGFHGAAVPTEFGGTLKSNKESGGGGGCSPRKQQKGVKNSYNGNYCGCFGGSADRRRGARDGGTARCEASFWAALLANVGICALLLGYVFIGSFVFLTIENFDRDAAATTHADDSSAMWYFAAQKSQTQANNEKRQQQKRDQKLQQPQQTTSESATWLPTDKRRIDKHKATANAEVSEATTTETRTSEALSQLDKPKRLTTDVDISVSRASTQHDKRQRRSSQQQPRPREENNDDDDDENYNEVHTLNMQSDELTADDELPFDALTVPEDVERQRAVDNIWEITVSLNILYKENWTRLAALEIQKFQDHLVKRLAMDLTLSSAEGRDPNRLHAVTMHRHRDAKQHKGHHQPHPWSHYPDLHIYDGDGGGRGGERRPRKPARHQPSQKHFEWNFATAFLYSLTVITTVGYGSISPRSTLGRMVTIGYATVGIPLTLIYLSSIGAILAKVARLLCTRALCCCFCLRRQRSCCCCCCYSAANAPSKERQLKLNRLRQQQQESIKMRAQQQQQHLAYCYVRPPATTALPPPPSTLQLHDVTGSGVAASDPLPHMLDASLDTLSVATTTTASRRSHTNPFGWSLLAPLALCLLLMLCYVAGGALAVALLEDWPLLDGVYFCFMSLTTIGFCDLLPGVGGGGRRANSSAVWFCSVYILSGLTLTAMCVNVLHEELLLRMRVVVKFKKVAARETKERPFYGAPS